MASDLDFQAKFGGATLDYTPRIDPVHGLAVSSPACGLPRCSARPIVKKDAAIEKPQAVGEPIEVPLPRLALAAFRRFAIRIERFRLLVAVKSIEALAAFLRFDRQGRYRPRVKTLDRDRLSGPPEPPMVEDRPAIQSAQQSMIEGGVQALSLDVINIEAGDLEIEIGLYTLTIRPPSREPVIAHGKVRRRVAPAAGRPTALVPWSRWFSTRQPMSQKNIPLIIKYCSVRRQQVMNERQRRNHVDGVVQPLPAFRTHAPKGGVEGRGAQGDQANGGEGRQDQRYPGHHLMGDRCKVPKPQCEIDDEMGDRIGERRRSDHASHDDELAPTEYCHRRRYRQRQHQERRRPQA